MLRAIPDTPEVTAGSVGMEDFTMVRDLFEKALPSPADSDAAVQEFYGGHWLPPLGSDGIESPVFGSPPTPFLGPYDVMSNGIAANLKHLAFDIRNMDHSIVAGPAGEQLEVIFGRFDPNVTDDALNLCSECPAHVQEQHGGVAYYRWGEDRAADRTLANAPPAFDRFGRGGRIAVLDSYVLRTLATDDMEALIDAMQGDTPSLADAEEFRLLGVGMSMLEAYRVMMVDLDFGVDAIVSRFTESGAGEEQKAEMRKKLLGGTEPLRSYLAFATGAGHDDEGPYMALMLVHADEVSAADNVQLLERRIAQGTRGYLGIWANYQHLGPWTERVDLQRSEIRSEGRLLSAKLRGEIALSPFRWVFEIENLIVHE